MIRSVLNKPLYFDPVHGVVQLIDDYAALSAKKDRTDSEEELLYICKRGADEQTVSRVPFSLLVASYQAALKDRRSNVGIIGRTEYAEVVRQDASIIKSELRFIANWLDTYAPEDVKFSLRQEVVPEDFSELERQFMSGLAQQIETAPSAADGTWFHQAIYAFKDQLNMEPKTLFAVLYRALIGKSSGPRAGWFLSILPRDWLIKAATRGLNGSSER